MENELAAKPAAVLCRGSSHAGDGTFDMNGCNARSPALAKPSPGMQRVYSEWIEFKRLLLQLSAIEAPAALDDVSWEGTVPVMARSLLPSLSKASGESGPAEFTIMELRGVPKAGLDHFVLVDSSNKPLYGAYVRSSQGEPCLQQLFEFSQTACDAGVFMPVPTVGGHFQGDYGLEYARHHFLGSTASLPELLRLPALSTSGFLHPSPGALLGVTLERATTAVTLARPCSHTSYRTDEGESPSKNADELAQPQVQQTVNAPPLDSSALEERIPDRCQPCSLCVVCKQFWGIEGLPGRHFERGVSRSQGEDAPAILCSEKTAARKRKWTQCRHGPKSKTSEYRGVNLYKRTWKWEAHIWHNGEQLYLGASITKTHAAQVYDRAALFLFGPDAEINFKPEGYQQEYEFMQRLSYGQMVVYLRRESRQNGEEVKYPGVAKVKPMLFSASYRPRKEKASHEHIGFFKTEEEALRAVLKEAKRRRNYEMAAKILDVHHLRSVRPATGKIKQERKSHAAFKEVSSKPFTRASKRAQPAPAKSNSSIKTQAAALLTRHVAVSPSTRQYMKKTVKSEASGAAKDSSYTVPMSTATPRGQEPESAPPNPTRTYIRKYSNAQEKCALKDENIEPPSVAVQAMESPPREGARAAGNRKNSNKSISSFSAKKRARGRDELLRLQREVLTEGEPSGAHVPLRRNQPRRCNYSTSAPIPSRQPELEIASREPGIASPPAVYPDVVLPQPMIVALPPAPLIATTPAQLPTSSNHPFIANPLPLAQHFMSISMSTGSKTTGSDGSGTQAAYSTDREAESSETLESQESGYASSSCLSFQSVGPTSKRGSLFMSRVTAVEEAKQEATRQFQDACDWFVTQRHHLHFLDSPRLSESMSPKSPGVIRPVARRLPLTNWILQPSEVPAAIASGAAQVSVNLDSPRHTGGGQLYVDIFGA